MNEATLPQRVIVIAGPTASGKSALAADLARRLHCPILSADSRQVYRGLDLGTGKDLYLYAAKPGNDAVSVRLIDVAEPGEVYSLFRYQQQAYAELRAWHQKAGAVHPIIICGGSGLYIEAVLRKYAMANVPEDEELRLQLMSRPVEDLIHELKTLDAEWAERTDCSSKKRVVRALEVAYARQRGPVALSHAPGFAFDILIFTVGYDSKTLRDSIATRLRERLQSGLIAEVQGLLDQGLSLARLQQLGLEYREVGEYCAGMRDYETMVRRLQGCIEDFAKRQATWFRGMPKRGLPTLDLPSDAESRLDFLQAQIEARWPDVKERFLEPAPVHKRFAMAILSDPQGRILLLRRSLRQNFAPGLWGLPGGHIQAGEAPDHAIRRELREELGENIETAIALEPGLYPVRDTVYGGHFEVHLFRGAWQGGPIVLNNEHSEYAWVSPENYAGYEVAAGVDEDLAYVQVWPLRFLNPKRLPPHLLP